MRQEIIDSSALIARRATISDSQGAIDFRGLLLRLTARACQVLNVCRFGKSERVVTGTGKSPEDFAVDVVAEYLSGSIKHDPATGTKGLLRVLSRAMEHDILDSVRSAAHKRTDIPEGAETEGSAGLDALPAADSAEPVELLDGERYKKAVFKLVEHDPELRELAYAVFEINALKPREIAGVCQTTAEDIQVRKKRFKRLLSAPVVDRIDKENSDEKG